MKKQNSWKWNKLVALCLVLAMLVCTPLGATGTYAFEGETQLGDTAPVLGESPLPDSGPSPGEGNSQPDIATPSEVPPLDAGTLTEPQKVEVVTPAAVLEVSDAAALESALGSVLYGGTIKLTGNITYPKGIMVKNKTVRLDIGPYTLDVKADTGTGFDVSEAGHVEVTGSGTLNINGVDNGLCVTDKGVFTADAAVTCTVQCKNQYYYNNYSLGNGVYVSGDSEVSLSGNVTGAMSGVQTDGSGTIRIKGNVEAAVNDLSAEGIYARGGTVTVDGNVKALYGLGIYCVTTGDVSVTGDVTGYNRGAIASGFSSVSDCTVMIGGNLKVTDTVHGRGVLFTGYGTITVEGEIFAPIYISYPLIRYDKEDTVPSDKPDYRMYQMPGYAGIVYVKDTTAYTITVVNGSGGGYYAPGVAVTITANIPAPGQQFKEWSVTPSVTFVGDTASTSSTAKFTMPAQAVTATATYEALPVNNYSITIQTDGNGTANANINSAAQGTEITLTSTSQSGYQFKEWQVVSGGVSITNNKFIMPAANVTVKAIFEPIPATTYTVTVNGSNAGTTGTGSYAQGTTVAIHAGSRSGYSFTRWTSSDGVTFANANSASTTFTMPGKNVAVTANWSYNGDSGGPSSGGDGGSYTPPTSNITTDKKPNQPTMASMNLAAPVDKNGVAAVTITEAQVKALIDTAKKDAESKGKTVDGIGVAFKIQFGADRKSVSVKLDEKTLALLEKEGMKRFDVNTPLASFSFDKSAIQEMKTQASETAAIKIKPVTKLSDAVKVLIGSRPVYDLTVSYQKNGKTKYITNFGKGVVTLGVAYKADEGEKIGNLYGVYVGRNGKLQLLANSSYAGGSVIFSRSSLSTYGIGYKAPAPAFTDTAKHWAKDNIDFVASRSLITGINSKTFAPDMAITRADFLMALGKLSGTDVSSYNTSRFTDVKSNNPAMSYIEWAVKNQIVQGIGNNEFGPGQKISRQEMAVMMHNYAKATGYKLPVSIEAVTFSDSVKIAAYAKDAVTTIQQAGIMQGKGNNIFDPNSSATRAEASTILRRFVELVIDEGTARGWSQNDSGQWRYINVSGKTVTGWLTVGDDRYYFTANDLMVSGKWLQIDGKWYYFNADGSLAINTKIDGYEVDENGVR
ncbi:MAG TPA: hypothetical protein GX523_03100, partial [Desulfitobacterium dehalogenans]|nr:hypothetical protein [Desulfitobacterium dehalogenans]